MELVWNRIRDPHLIARRLTLGDLGFTPDPSLPERCSSGFAFYHYTWADRIDAILGEGLRASRALNCPRPPGNLAGKCAIAGFLVPLPAWLDACPYFGDLGRRLARQYVGDTLLRAVVPDASRYYVADCAHRLQRRHYQDMGERVLTGPYDLSNPDDVRQAYVDSYISIGDYDGGHVAPVCHLVLDAPGIAVPPGRIDVCRRQPFREHPCGGLAGLAGAGGRVIPLRPGSRGHSD